MSGYQKRRKSTVMIEGDLGNRPSITQYIKEITIKRADWNLQT